MSHMDTLLENHYVISVSQGVETSKDDCQSVLYIEAKPEVFQQSKKFNQQASDSVMDIIHMLLKDGGFDRVDVFPPDKKNTGVGAWTMSIS